MQITGEIKLSQSAKKRVLIVDDEVSIRRTLEAVFRDEGFEPFSVDSGSAALSKLQEIDPDLVILDIWMPGMDGVETLKRVKELSASLPVIMISGHATIATAIAATKMGASDFIEKPLDLDALLLSVQRALNRDSSSLSQVDGNEANELGLDFGVGVEGLLFDPIALKDQKAAGRNFPQATLARSALLYGQGLHSGKKSGLILEPLPVNSGIHFIGVSNSQPVPAHVDFVESTGFATTVRLGQTQAGTIEHLMSALHAFGICNLLVKCNGEVPVLDGSAREFCSLFADIGIDLQAADWKEIVIKDKLRVGNEREFIQIEPADEFIIDYTLDYPKPVGRQQMTFVCNNIESYKKEIAPARTFGFVRDIGFLQKQGLALGGRFDNFVLFGEEGPINDALRFPNEPVRHKILDMIGDLYLLGRRLRGKVTACMTGHSDNVALLKLIRDAIKS